MLPRVRSILVPLVAVALVGGNCDDEGPLGNNNPPSNLSGTYALFSISGVVTGGAELGPPMAQGMITLMQMSTAGSEATGSFTVMLTLPGAPPFSDSGTYTNDADGNWSQAGNLQQGSGTYTVQGNQLTVVVTQPPTAASTVIWVRQ